MAVNDPNFTDHNYASGSIVVGYFPNGEEAQRAITELQDEGFQVNDIGAAFHSAGAGTSSAGRSSSSQTPGKEVGPLQSPGTTGVGSGGTGARSDSGAVTPAGLASGSGTSITGAGRPGPIPGSDIPHHRAASAEPVSAGYASNGPATLTPGITPGTGSTDTTPAEGTKHEHSHEGESWWQRLKHIFGDDSETDALRSGATQTRSSMNFGTGEGHLGVTPQNTPMQYSGRAFESSFSGMGVPPEHSRRIAHELGQGGAVVTVRAGVRASEAEAILERNGGRVRYESSTTETTWGDSGLGSSQIEVFGDVRRSYRPLSDQDKEDIRRAS